MSTRFYFFFFCFVHIAGSGYAQRTIDWVNPFIGTAANGHTYPGATLPFGMVQLSPDCKVGGWDWAAGYRYDADMILGFSHTHLSGTGVGDLGDVLLMPFTGALKYGRAYSKDAPGQASVFDHANETASPGYYAVTLATHGVKAELTATARAGMHRYTYTTTDTARLGLDLHHVLTSYAGENGFSVIRVVDKQTIIGTKISTGWAAEQHIYTYIRFSSPFTDMVFCNSDSISQTYGKDKNAQAIFTFADLPGRQLTVKVGISAVDVAGAQKNLVAEIPGFDFDAVRAQAEQEWEKALSSVQANFVSDADKRTFYTALYHSYLAPTLYQDVDGRYRGLDKSIHQHSGFTYYTTFSLWDTFRAAHPLYTITQPNRVGDMVNSLLAHYRESQDTMLPLWPLHGNETYCMIGYHSLPVIAEALKKGITGINRQEAYEAMRISALKDYRGGGYFAQLGYVPMDKEKESASKTLEYAYDDYCLAEAAALLERYEDEKTFRKRALNYHNIFDSQLGFMRGRNSDGKFAEPFDPRYIKHGSAFTEGNSWQYTWFVPHDVPGLIKLMGGEKQFEHKLSQLFEASFTSAQDVRDVSGLIGQYAHGNEPSHHIPYLYNYVGSPAKTQMMVRRIMREMYTDKPDGLCGNEDCGQMSAWYVFSALGFYPVNPTGLQYDLGSPLVSDAVIHLPNGFKFEVKTLNQAEKNVLVKEVKLNGKKLNRQYITHQEIMDGGKLEFVMMKAK